MSKPLRKKLVDVVDSIVAPKQKKVVVTNGLLEACGIPKRFWNVDWGKVQSEPHCEYLYVYLEVMDEAIREGRGMVLWGPNRRGKTACAVLILIEALKRGYDVHFVRSADYVDEKMRKKSWDELGEMSLEDEVREADLVVVDDVGKEAQRYGNTQSAVIDNLIRARDADKKATIVTTNVIGFDKLVESGAVRLSTVALMSEMMIVLVDGKNFAADAQDWWKEKIDGD